MELDRARIHAEIAWIRLRGYGHTAVKIAGFALVLLAVFNMAAVHFTTFEAVAPYREPIATLIHLEWGAATLIPDLLVFTAGLILAWWG